MIRPLSLLIFGALFPMVASSHHAVGAFFDLSRPMVVEGTVASMRWQNPHVLITIESGAGNSGFEAWQVTSGGPTLLRRYGVTADIVAVGERVAISGFPSRVHERTMIGVSIDLADGRSMPMFPSPLATRFGHRLNSGVHISEHEAEQGKSAAKGIFRVWSYGRTLDRPVANPSFTPQALAGQAEYNPLVDDPALRCEAQGMPILMDNPFPIEFTDRGKEIILNLEVWDIERTIHMAGDQDAESNRGTPLGYSAGYWEDNTLVVTTTDIDWRYFDDAGTPQGGLMKSVERFTVSVDESRLDYEVIITDPETLLEPMTISWHWDWVPGEAIQPYNCTLVE